MAYIDQLSDLRAELRRAQDSMDTVRSTVHKAAETLRHRHVTHGLVRSGIHPNAALGHATRLGGLREDVATKTGHLTADIDVLISYIESVMENIQGESQAAGRFTI